jgi:hypothetical protein
LHRQSTTLIKASNNAHGHSRIRNVSLSLEKAQTPLLEICLGFVAQRVEEELVELCVSWLRLPVDFDVNSLDRLSICCCNDDAAYIYAECSSVISCVSLAPSVTDINITTNGFVVDLLQRPQQIHSFVTCQDVVNLLLTFDLLRKLGMNSVVQNFNQGIVIGFASIGNIRYCVGFNGHESRELIPQ